MLTVIKSRSNRALYLLRSAPTPPSEVTAVKSLVYIPLSSNILLDASFSELLKISISLDLDLIQNC